jgi:hypothetical protein
MLGDSAALAAVFCYLARSGWSLPAELYVADSVAAAELLKLGGEHRGQLVGMAGDLP